MASAVPEEFSKHLECAVCMEQFKEPKVLPCLHTYCTVCLEKLVKKQQSDHVITCPECRRDTKIIDGDVGKLQSNFWVNNFMSLLSIEEKGSSGNALPCENCNTGDQAVSRCTECSVNMCDFCVTAHRRVNATSGHQILSISEVQKLGSKALAKPSFCEKHTSETLKLFCITCQETICEDCTIVDHREHKYNFVVDVAEKERKVLQVTLTKAKNKELAVSKGLEAVQVMKQLVQGKVLEVNNAVDEFFNEQVKALEYYRANLKHEVATQGQGRLVQLEEQSRVLSSFLAQLKNSVESVTQAMADGNDVTVLTIKNQLSQRLTQLNSANIKCKPCQNEYFKLQLHETIWDVKKMPTVRYKSVDPQKCTVSIVGGEEGVMYRTLAGQNVQFALTMKDREVELGEPHVAASVAERGGSEEALPVLANGDGSYTFSYCPKCTGTFTLSVTLDGQEVLGSPFKWEAYSVLPTDVNTNLACEQVLWWGDQAIQPLGGGLRKSNGARRRVNDVTAFTDGKYCWRLGLDNSNYDYNVEIGVMARVSGMFSAKWSWECGGGYEGCYRSDGEWSSITTTEINDKFTVFLNFETQTLRIYNNRSKETEIFTDVSGNELVAVTTGTRVLQLE